MFLHIDPAAGPVLVAGAGPVGARKVRTLLDNGFAVHWVTGDAVSSAASELIAGCQGHPGLVVSQRGFAAQDLKGCWLAVAATSDTQVNAEIADLAARGARLCVRADQPDSPARMVSQRSIESLGGVAVTTAGQAPALARTLADWLAVLLSGQELKHLVEFVAGMSGEQRRAWGATTRQKLQGENAKKLQEAGDRWFADWLPREARK